MPEAFGATITFDLMEFPAQTTTCPDPVQGLCAWTRQYFPDAKLVAADDIPAVWKPSDEAPAVYWRFDSAVGDDKMSSYAVNWYTGQFAAHVITDSVVERNRWIKAIAEQFRVDGELILADKSPMFVKHITTRHNADPLREGQLTLTGQYGVLAQQRRERSAIPLNNVVIANPMNGGNQDMAKMTSAGIPADNGAPAEQKMGVNEQLDSKYSVNELAAAARDKFNALPEVAAAALMMAGKTHATVDEATVIIDEFLKRKVT
jgi:hypothetical protein